MPTWMVPAILIMVGVLCVLFVVFVIVVSARAHRRKQAELQAAVEALGLSFMPKGDKTFGAAWAVITPLIKGGSVTNVVFGTLASGLRITAFKHYYVVSTGKSAHVVHHAVTAVDTPVWPKVEIKRRGAMMKFLRGMFNREKVDPAAPVPVALDNVRAAFEKDWIIDAEDAAFTEAILTDQTLLAMSLHEKVVSWWFVGGKMAVLRSDALTPDLLVESIAQIESVWAAVPEALKQADWMSGVPRDA